MGRYPDFTISRRDGKLALWVNGQNIWDISEGSLTHEVRKALVSAYMLGVKHSMEKIGKVSSDAAMDHSGIVGDFRELGE